MRLMRLLLAIAALTLAACGDDPRPQAPPPRTGPLVTYEHGGGIAAQPRRLVVDRDGHARLTVRTGADETTRRFDLHAEQLRRLEDELINAQGDAAPDVPTACADCFVYTIAADDVDVTLDEANLEHATNDLRRLVSTLERLSA